MPWIIPPPLPPSSSRRIDSSTHILSPVLRFLRDVTCDQGANVLLSRYGAVKLADFGTSKLMGQESVLSGLKGTPHWMAPEVIRDQQRGHKGWIRADVWSVGCTVIEMLTGRKPWADVPNAVAVMFKIARGLTPPIDR